MHDYYVETFTGHARGLKHYLARQPIIPPPPPNPRPKDK